MKTSKIKTNTVASKKQKGKRLELKIASMWRKKVDGFAIPTPGSGNGQNYKEDVYNKYFSIEAKNQEKVKLWEWWEQARSHPENAKPPVLCISGNYRPILAVMDFSQWLDLVKEAKIEK
jgi:hypothetical protein